MNVQEYISNKNLRDEARACPNKNSTKNIKKLFNSPKKAKNIKLYSFDRSGLDRQTKSIQASQLSSIISIIISLAIILYLVLQ